MDPKALITNSLNHFVEQGDVATPAVVATSASFALIAATNVCGHM
jgi:hypothetical protein